ncbi:MAG: DUF421 domain-containing protein [Polyangiaceae bacterium]|nr:DUF421 domain-containing protein [Polyangiaceae bacterium]
MFQPKTSLLEVAVRVVIIYVFLLVLLRLSGKKEFAQLEPMDLLIMLILSETVSPALTDDDTSLPVAFVAAGTLAGLTVLTSYITFRFRKAEKIIQGSPNILIKDGKVNEDVLRKERITDQQLHTVLHKEGLKSVEEVEKAYIEPSGDVSIIKKEPKPS